MYSLVRIILFIILFALLFCLIRKSGHYLNRKGIVTLAVVCCLLCSLAHFFPIENNLFLFSTPEAVFRYTNFEQIGDVVYGCDSCMVIYATGSSRYSHTFVGRNENSFVILPQYSEIQLARNFEDVRIMNVYRVRNTDDYYVMAFFNYGTEVELFDSSGKVDTHIVVIEEPEFFSTFYIYVENLSEDHYLLVDGDRIGIIR